MNATTQALGLAFLLVGVALLFCCLKLKTADVDESVWRPVGFGVSFLMGLAFVAAGGGALLS